MKIQLMSMLTLLATTYSIFAFPTQGSVPITIDATKKSKISPYIYGVNYPDTWIYEWLEEWRHSRVGFTLAREGGNRFTAYNWETNASNAGNDYFFENDDYLGLTNEPGWTVKKFLSYVQSSGAAVLLTVPTLGYVSADKDTNRDGGRDVNHSKDYLNTRFFRSFPRKPGRHFEYPPNRDDRSVYQDEFVHWVQSTKSNRSPVWFSLDNEPDLWHGTHLRISPIAPTYADIIQNNIEYASAIKGVAPDSVIFGPVNYGWYGFRAFQGAPDAKGRVFVDAYLDAIRGASAKAAKRLVDVYDFHWYPEAKGEGVRIVYNQAPDKPGTVTARIQAPRSLWDPSYVEDSWITESNGKKPVRLIPDMQDRIKAHYPGTKLAISEYDFGGRNSISGALAQADALGVFGREGLFAACHWGLNSKDKAALAGFQSFTNFDRMGQRFGDIGLKVMGETPSENSIYAALDSANPERMTIVAINKTSTVQSLSIQTRGFRPKSAMAFAVKEGVYEIPQTWNCECGPKGLQIAFPPMSVTTIAARRS